MTPESNEQIETAKDSAAVVTELAASDDPRAVSETLREQPVVRIGDMFTLVTRRKDVEASLRNPAVFSSNSDAVKLGNVRPLIPLQIDPPKHVKYRRVLDPMFAPREVAKLEPEVVTIVNSLIDEFSSKGTCDFHERVAVPLPCTVFLRLMGLPYSELERFLAMKDGIVRPPGETLESQAPVRDETAREIYAYFQEVIDERRSSPGDDLITRITNFELDGERLTDDEVL
ncbi:MAG: cytochrome P450, partial [Actinobacteria bacterium]|nr:cytochrome P450 [Actinomycetota bacterium]